MERYQVNGTDPFEPPQITDEDVHWVSDILSLPDTAFIGPDGQDPRREILKSTETMDIEACPGSGKTTLLVAKLAIVARKWVDMRRGICVLSHTNVARLEIEKRLGNTAVGQRLLSYPHFVGTIQGFVDNFLAMPWLRSLGYPIRVIDDQHCTQHRRRLLERGQFSKLRNYVASKEGPTKQDIVSAWRVSSPSFEVMRGDKPEFKGGTSDSAKQLCALARMCSTEDGYHRYNEMFMWGTDLLENLPETQRAIRHRFPMLFIDEVQDNSERQSALLFKVFMDGENPAIRQRYGDSNQAIYGYTGDTGATSDEFPNTSIKKDIPNSHRFGQEIADFANPLGVVPQALVGCGPQDTRIVSATSGRHTLFLFGDETIQRVFPTYGNYLCEVFSGPELLLGDFTVVAGVHRPGPDDKLPRFLGQYWPEYDSELTASDPKPKTLIQYVMAGRMRSERSGEAHPIVESFAEGIVRLIRLSNPTTNVGVRKRKHRHLVELLADNATAKTAYLDLMTRLGLDQLIPSLDDWHNDWSPTIMSIAEAACGSQIDAARVSAFLQWPTPLEVGQATDARVRDNVFRYPADDPKVHVRVGSIHSVKGETHTATLVLDTFYNVHNLATLKPWLLGAKAGGQSQGIQNQSRLRQHYVAMTRPTNLLCLAMREDAFVGDEIEQIKNRGWRAARVTDADATWL